MVKPQQSSEDSGKVTMNNNQARCKKTTKQGNCLVFSDYVSIRRHPIRSYLQETTTGS